MSNWEIYQNAIVRYPELGFSLDYSRMDAPSLHSGVEWSPKLKDAVQRAYEDRKKIEAGEIMNPDEDRAVGHYWLRNPDLAPKEKGEWIRDVKQKVETFAGKVLDGEITA